MQDPYILMRGGDELFLLHGEPYNLLPLFVAKSDALYMQLRTKTTARRLTVEFLAELLELEAQGQFRLAVIVLREEQLICVEIPAELREHFRKIGEGGWSHVN